MGATGIFASTCPVGSSSVNLVSERNIAAVGPPGVVRPSGVGVATLALGGARVLFVVCQVEEWSCHIFSSDFSPCVPLSKYNHSPRVSFSVLVGCLAFSLVLEVPFPSAGGL